MLPPIVLAVVVTEFFTRLYVPPGQDEYTLLLLIFHWLAIWCAGMVDVPAHIVSAFAIDGHQAFKLEKIFAAAPLHFCRCDDWAPVFCDHLAFSDRNYRKQAKAVRTAPNACILMQQTLHRHLSQERPGYPRLFVSFRFAAPAIPPSYAVLRRRTRAAHQISNPERFGVS